MWFDHILPLSYTTMLCQSAGAPVHLFRHGCQVLLATVGHLRVLERLACLDDRVQVDTGARVQVTPHHHRKVEQQSLANRRQNNHDVIMFAGYAAADFRYLVLINLNTSCIIYCKVVYNGIVGIPGTILNVICIYHDVSRWTQGSV